ncbi:MAG: GNAT family N-acetyltransferase, partial [Proteobacteria bacterium]|nr:GNAT family N-acetyltransferase [Pseudomonadota bacterium]
MTLANEEQRAVFENNSWKHFRKDLREMVCVLTTYPVKTKMTALSKKNFWSASNLSVTDEQMEFVLDAKTSIGMALLYKTKKAYVQMEGDTTVGLLVLDVDFKKDKYIIDIVLVDTKFQGRGYGKKM